MGRPPIQHHKVVHTIALSPETEEAIDKLRETWLLTKGIRAGGEALRGGLSHPLGFASISLAAGILLARIAPELAALFGFGSRGGPGEPTRPIDPGEDITERATKLKSGLEQILEKYAGGDWGPPG